MKVVIYGTGGVGAYFGGRLFEAGIDVRFIARGEHLKAIRDNGLQVDSIQGNFIIHPEIVTDDPSHVGEVDLVIVCVKGWQVSEVAVSMQPMIGENTLILPLLNGVEAVGTLSAVLGSHRVLNGLCGIFAKQVAPGHISHLGASPWLQFGEQNNLHSDRAEKVLTLLQSTTGFRSTLVDNITTAVWRKFIFIASTSGVGAVTRATFGEVLAHSQSRDLLKAAIDEIVLVGKALNVDLPEDINRQTWQRIEQSEPNSDTSMQRDIQAAKPSELENQTGAVIRLAQQLKIATPVNAMIYACLLPQETMARRTSGH